MNYTDQISQHYSEILDGTYECADRIVISDRKHELAEQYIPKEEGFNGIFLILVSRFPAVVWDVHKKTKHLEKKNPYPFVNHYWFHIMDKDWGHITVRISAHPL